jgi:hypothetical protein
MGSLQQAFTAAKSRYPGEQWSSLPTKDQSAAIYVELRRLDAEDAKTVVIPTASVIAPTDGAEIVTIRRRGRPPQA